MSKIALAFALCIAPAIVAAQTVYQCVGPTGAVIFSQTPCGKDAKLVMGSKTPVKHTAADDDDPQPATPKAADKSRPDPNIQAISDSADDANCRRTAQRNAIVPSKDKINSYYRSIAEIKQSEAYIYGNAATVTAAINGSENQIMGYRNLIAQEEQKNNAIQQESDRNLRDALAECDKKKAEREKAATL